MCICALKKMNRSTKNINNNAVIKELESEDTYKYLSLEKSERKENEIMKHIIRREYLDRLKTELKKDLKWKGGRGGGVSYCRL